jgi:hypothetical protein
MRHRPQIRRWRPGRAHRFAALLAFLVGPVAESQGTTPSRPFAPSSLQRLVAALADDSLGGRATPSPGLEAAARIIAGEFGRAGLAPLGDDETFFQRFPVVESSLDVDSTRIEIPGFATWRFGADYFYGGGQGTSPFGVLRGEALIVSGTVTPENVAGLGIEKKIVLYLPSPGIRRDDAYRSVFTLSAAGASAVIFAGGMHDSTWVRLRADRDELKPMTAAAWPVWTAAKPEGRVHFVPVLELWRGRFRDLVMRAGIDTSALRESSGAPKVTRLGVDAALHFPRQVDRVSMPPNVVGLVRGRDPLLRNEYVVVTAHFDGLGVKPGFPPGPQGTLNGADDNASGVAAMIEMARAMTGAAAPRRSVLFVAVSGEEVGLWGSDHFASKPPVPRRSMVANVNVDMVGRAVADSVFVLTSTDAMMAAAVPMVLRRPGGPRVVALDNAAFTKRYPDQPIDNRSDHANFSRRGIPFVYLFTGWHRDYHETSDDPASLNYEGLATIARIAHEITVALANR